MLAQRGIIDIDGQSVADLLTPQQTFATPVDGKPAYIATGETFIAQGPIELRNTIRVTRVDQRGDRLSIGLQDRELGRLSVIVEGAEGDSPLAPAKLSMEGFRLPLEAGQAITLTCLWGDDDSGGLRQRSSLPADTWEPVSDAYLDPRLALGHGQVYSGRQSVATLLHARRQLLSPTLSHAYRHPLKIVRGDMAHLIAEDGRRYLDLVNNVCHVGHANPRVVEAGSRPDGRAEHQHPLPPRHHCQL